MKLVFMTSRKPNVGDALPDALTMDCHPEEYCSPDGTCYPDENCQPLNQPCAPDRQPSDEGSNLPSPFNR